MRLNRLLPLSILLGLLLLRMPPSVRSQDEAIDLLLLGSTHSFSETGESGVEHQPAFDPTAIAAELGRILESAPGIEGRVNIVFEDIYRTKTIPTALGQSGTNYDFNYRCHSLAQYFMWPEGREQRLANLRGEDGTAWDHVVILGDPYLMATMPGIHAEGVNLVAAEVAAGTAEPMLLMLWPREGSSAAVAHFAELAYRIGDSAQIAVAPAGLAWDRWPTKDAAPQHPTPDGAYLAAASIYSRIFGRSASEADYEHDDTIGDHVLANQQAESERAPYDGAYAFISPFAMQAVKKRHINYNQTGSSSEAGIQQALNAAMDRSMVTHTRFKAPPWADGIAPVDFNYGRGNSWFEPEKRYMLDPELYRLSFGFPMQDQKGSAATSMLYGIDKRYGYEDGTDLGIAYDMIREGELEANARAIPMRLMWAKIHDAKPSLTPLRDNWHMSRILDEASGTFMYTLLSGRCPVDEEPADRESGDWDRWLGRKVGYETAWRMAHLTGRAPCLRVLPSSTKAAQTSEFTVRFMFPPEHEVVVSISVDHPDMLSASPSRLVFTPEDHASPQTVKITGYIGADPEAEYRVFFATESQDAIFDGLGDEWTVRVVDPVATAPPMPTASPAPSATPTPGRPTAAPTATGTGTGEGEGEGDAGTIWLPKLDRNGG